MSLDLSNHPIDGMIPPAHDTRASLMEENTPQQHTRAPMAFCTANRNAKSPIIVGSLCMLLLLSLHSLSAWPRFEYSLTQPESSTFFLTQMQRQQLSKSGSSFLSLTDAEQICRSHGLNIYPARQTHRKVYDLFLIGTEMDWAEIRLNELASHVDYFVILESSSTFTNHSKPLHLKNNWDKFAQFEPQIIYHVLEDDAIKDAGAWEREYYQRNALIDQIFPRLLGPQAPNHGDVILVSDVDEIPRPQTIAALRNCDIPKHVTINSRWYLYSFQWHALGDDWYHPQATYWQGFAETPRPESIRMAPPDVILRNGSWSCTTCFKKVAQVINKINSFSHQEFNQEQFTDAAEIVHRVRNGIDVFDRAGMQYEKIVGNLDVPEYLRRNKDKFAYLMDRDPLDANFVDWDATKGTFRISA